MKAGLLRSATATDRQKMGPSNIRGRISNPIPIPNAGDEDFTSRNLATSLPEPHVAVEGDPVSQRPPRHHHAAPSSSSLPPTGPAPVSGNASDVAHSGNGGSDNSLPASAAPAGSSGPSPTSGLARDSPHRRRTTNQSSQIRYSAISTSSQRTGGTANKDAPQRKKSTIRGALSKLFGRKKKAKSQGSTIPEHSSGTTSVQYRSGLSTLSRAPKESEPKRSASLPITEYDRALRSHSVGPGDMTAIESARNSFHTDYNYARRRAATTSTQLYPLVRVKDGELAGLSPRPASTHAHSSGILDNPEEIGRAITSDLNGLRRRSRSLSGLGDLGGVRNGGLRRRSDEIRYWRESYGPGFASPLSSSNVPEVDDGGVGAADVPADATASERPKSPPEPFNFGSLATVNAMAGMRITHAANLDNRLGALEARMRRLEILINRVRSAAPEPESPVFGRGPPRSVPTASDATLAYTSSTGPPDPPLYRTVSRDGGTTVAYSESRPSEDTQMSFDEASAFRGSLRPPPGAHTRRPTSNSTIRGAASLPALSREANGSITTDHYATLLALLETERSTRRSLEDQVRRLTRTVDGLTKRSGTGMLLDPPPTARSFGGQSVFDDDTTDDGNDESERNTPKRRSPDLEDSGIAPGLEDTDDDLAETFATPREEGALGFGAFGEELREDDEDGNRKKAARTLSLSQLTVAKGQRRA